MFESNVATESQPELGHLEKMSALTLEVFVPLSQSHTRDHTHIRDHTQMTTHARQVSSLQSTICNSATSTKKLEPNSGHWELHWKAIKGGGGMISKIPQNFSGQ